MLSINYQTLAKLIAESSKAVGKALSNPNVQATIVVVTGVISDYVSKGEVQKEKAEEAEKELLYKKALAEQQAMISILEEEANKAAMREEDYKYMVKLNKELRKQTELCRKEDAHEQV